MDDIKLLQGIERASTWIGVANSIARPLEAIGAVLGIEYLERSAGAVARLDVWRGNAEEVVLRRWESSRSDRKYWDHSQAVRCLWEGSPVIARLGNDWVTEYRMVLGVPVGFKVGQHGDDFNSPIPLADILARMRVDGHWLIRAEGALARSDKPTPDAVSTKVMRIIERTRKFGQCRSWLLEGPPGSAKTIAAQQMARALGGGGWITVPARAAGDEKVWALLSALRPSALILDDVDSLGGSEDMLLERVESARAWARVIISTANTAEILRGALRRPGRLADDHARFEGLDEATVDLIAPTCPSEAKAKACERGLLASYVAELEARHEAGVLDDGFYSGGDIEDLAATQALVGDR